MARLLPVSLLPASAETPAQRILDVIRALAVVTVGAVVLGALTSPAQTVFPAWLRPLANSVGGWTMLAYLLVWFSRAKPLGAAFLGVIAFAGLDNGYRIVAELRGFPYTAGVVSSWTIIGIIVGPLIGAAAGLVRHKTRLWRALAVTPLAAVLLSDGLVSLARVSESTGITWWILEISLASAWMALALIRTHVSPREQGIVLGIWLCGALATLGGLVAL